MLRSSEGFYADSVCCICTVFHVCIKDCLKSLLIAKVLFFKIARVQNISILRQNVKDVNKLADDFGIFRNISTKISSLVSK